MKLFSKFLWKIEFIFLSVQICGYGGYGDTYQQAWGQDACEGDSGGALTYEEENLSYLIGVVSYGNKHCGCPT